MPRDIFFSAYTPPAAGLAVQAVGHSTVTHGQRVEELRTDTEPAVRLDPAKMERRAAIPLFDAASDRRFCPAGAKGEFAIPDDGNDPRPNPIEDPCW